MAIDVIIEDPRWEDAGLEALVVQAVDAFCARVGLEADLCEGSVLACNDARIKVLNADFREKDKATNVLSWPADERATPEERPPLPAPSFDGMIELGDIAISYDTCVREAEAADKPMADHVTHLIIHGLLHLLGYDHISDRDAEIMEATEVEILATLGLEDPY